MSTSPTSTPSIDVTLKKFAHWRKNKSHNASVIPNALWLQCFELAKEHGIASVKVLFGLSHSQYKKKYHELIESKQPEINTGKSKVASVVDFAQAQPAIESSWDISDDTQSTTEEPASNFADDDLSPKKKRLPSYIDVTTIIVECIRPDGYRLRLHTTTDSITEVMQAFFEVKEILA